MDMTDLIRLLCGFREEKYPYERVISHFAFAAWLHYPRNQYVSDGARTTAAATILSPPGPEKATWQLTPSEHRRLVATLDLDQIATLLRTPPLYGGYSYDFKSLDNVARQLSLSSIVLFLLRCPPEEKGGINKALDFIEAGGFAEKGEKPPSRPTLNRHWSAMAEVAPFVTAADCLFEDRILELCPESPESIDFAIRFEPQGARTFFGFAKRIQSEILNRLHVISRRNVASRFVTFPEELKTTKHKIPLLQKDQIELLKGYKKRREAALERQIERSSRRHIGLYT